MKVIFLDVDGVLNSEKTCHEWHEKTGKNGYGGHFSEEDVCTDENIKWGKDLVANLKNIVDKTEAVIVISSTWRKYFSINKFKEMFKVYDWDAPVIDRTPNSNARYRGMEINTWMSGKDIEKYVILDDDTDFLPNQLVNFVNTNGIYGLTEQDSLKAINILNHA